MYIFQQRKRLFFSSQESKLVTAQSAIIMDHELKIFPNIYEDMKLFVSLSSPTIKYLAKLAKTVCAA